MKVRLERLPLENKGVILVSETPAEKLRLEEIWNGHGAVVSLTRLPDGQVELAVAPIPEN